MKAKTMKDNPSVLIMMTSYNGEKYIRKQIESIVNQTYKNWILLIQDDSSSDRTVSIINEYVKADDRIKVLTNKGKRGVYNNFHSLINKCKKYDFDFYMFSDHDDIWYVDKIRYMINFFQDNTVGGIPTMIYGDMEIINGQGKITGKRVNELLKLEYKSRFDPFYNHTVFGCNCMMNKELFVIVPAVDIDSKITPILCHDNYYAKYATMFGRLIYMDKVLMYYRRYGDNVTAKHDYSNGLKKILYRLTKIDSLAKDHARTYSQSIFTINCMLKNDTNNELAHLEEIKRSLIIGGCTASKCFIKYKISCGFKIRTFSRLIILFIGIYKKYLLIE